jgi:hypothetical protein
MAGAEVFTSPRQGKALELHFTVEGDGVFTTPWSALIIYRRPNRPPLRSRSRGAPSLRTSTPGGAGPHKRRKKAPAAGEAAAPPARAYPALGGKVAAAVRAAGLGDEVMPHILRHTGRGIAGKGIDAVASPGPSTWKGGARQPANPLDHQHRGLYGAGAGPVQGLLAGLICGPKPRATMH